MSRLSLVVRSKEDRRRLAFAPAMLDLVRCGCMSLTLYSWRAWRSISRNADCSALSTRDSDGSCLVSRGGTKNAKRKEARKQEILKTAGNCLFFLFMPHAGGGYDLSRLAAGGDLHGGSVQAFGRGLGGLVDRKVRGDALLLSSLLLLLSSHSQLLRSLYDNTQYLRLSVLNRGHRLTYLERYTETKKDPKASTKR